jgi:hypothetical protein
MRTGLTHAAESPGTIGRAAIPTTICHASVLTVLRSPTFSTSVFLVFAQGVSPI